ncbi:glycerate dehydrogenase [Exophiala viscosa]|uniref:glycerate dehydrogenase n=1 Tax=Exophiala viscosa TaxID=2486360 RepID=UPI00219B0144|nr:glycerate dehydrogenase [Exophiala viscosa]
MKSLTQKATQRLSITASALLNPSTLSSPAPPVSHTRTTTTMSSQQHKIAILDDYAGIAESYFSHLSSQLEIQSFPDTLNTCIPSEHQALIERLTPFTIISTMRERTILPASVLSALPNLKLLLTTGMKNASIDTATLKSKNVVYLGTGPKPNAVKGYDATNEMTWSLILGLSKTLVEGDTSIRQGGWQPGLALPLAGRTLGLLGLGKLGTQAAVTGILGFGMKVLAWSSSLTQEKADEAAKARGLPAGSFKVASSKHELFSQADVLSVHYVLSERSRGIVGAEELEAMKSSAILVNTSRGPLIDEASLVDALEHNKIRAAGLDVYDTEPLPKDSPWRRDGYWGVKGRSKVLVSPHMGYVEEETMHSWYEQQAESVRGWLAGGEVKKVIS